MYKIHVKEIFYEENSSSYEYEFRSLSLASEWLLDSYYEWIDNIDNDEDIPSSEIFHEENLLNKVNSCIPLFYVGHEDQSEYYIRVYISNF